MVLDVLECVSTFIRSLICNTIPDNFCVGMHLSANVFEESLVKVREYK